MYRLIVAIEDEIPIQMKTEGSTVSTERALTSELLLPKQAYFHVFVRRAR